MVKESLQKPLVSVAIVTWNRSRYVLRAIESVYKQTYCPIEVVVVDSASIDDTVTAIKEKFPEVRVIQLHRNMGCPEGRNIAMANCFGDIIFSLDDDAWLSNDTVDLCVARFQKEQDLGVISCRVLSPNEINPSKMEGYYTYVFSGGASTFRKDVLRKAGYYPSDFFRQAEESDLALRVLESKYAIIKYPEAVVYHEETLSNIKNKFFFFYGCRNELYTVIRRYPLFLVPFGIIWKAIVWNWVGVQKKALHYTVGACIVIAIRFPQLIFERQPVSFRTIKKVMTLKFSRKFV